MTRISTFISCLVFAAPLAAHDGMALGGLLHRALHAVGTDTALAVGGIVVAAVAVAVVRRVVRRAPRRATR